MLSKQPSSSPDLKKIPFFSFLFLFVVIVAVNLRIAAPFLIAILFGLILAQIVTPLQRRIERKLSNRVSALLTILIVMLVIGIPAFLISEKAIREGLSLSSLFSRGEANDPVNAFIDRLTEKPVFQSLAKDPAQIKDKVNHLLNGAAHSLESALFSILSSLPFLLIKTVLMLMACYSQLREGPKVDAWLSKTFFIDDDIRRKFVTAYRDTVSAVVRANTFAGLVAGIIVFFAFLVLGVPRPFLAGAGGFILTWIPMIGSGPISLLGVFYLLVQGSSTKASLMLVFGLVAALSDNFVRPHVLKGTGETSIPSLLSLVAILGGLRIFGIVGVFFGPILIALFLTFSRVWPVVVRRYYSSGDPL